AISPLVLGGLKWVEPIIHKPAARFHTAGPNVAVLPKDSRGRRRMPGRMSPFCQFFRPVTDEDGRTGAGRGFDGGGNRSGRPMVAATSAFCRAGGEGDGERSRQHVDFARLLNELGTPDRAGRPLGTASTGRTATFGRSAAGPIPARFSADSLRGRGGEGRNPLHHSAERRRSTEPSRPAKQPTAKNLSAQRRRLEPNLSAQRRHFDPDGEGRGAASA
ncbi:hypothetical protein, partial [Azospirillum palustre]